MTGEIGILNVGAGDTKLSFDPSKPAEVKLASKTVKDMLRRGYAIFVEVGTNEKGPIYQRATDFDEATAEYLIVGTPDEPEEMSEQDPPSKTQARTPQSTRHGSRKRRIPAASTKGVAVARTAGG